MDEAIPPKKRRRGRKALIVLACLLLAVLVARLIWGFWADSVLRQEIAAIAARGEKLAWKDLAPQPIPDEQNAAEVYKPQARPHFMDLN